MKMRIMAMALCMMALSAVAQENKGLNGNGETPEGARNGVEGTEVPTPSRTETIGMGREVEQQSIGNGENEPAGFVTELLNNALEKAADKTVKGENADDKVEYGRDVTRFVSVPKFGGYGVGSYKYSSQEGMHNGSGFGIRMVRMYVDGTILKDFDYRIQLEYAGTVHLKDVYVEWKRFKELRVKMGQFKRCFTFEDPYNPWEVGIGDYGQVTKKLSGFSDYSHSEFNGSNGGRDIGLQLQGDLLAVGKDHRRLFHYQLAVFNGQGINTTDANGKKDWMGTVQIQPVKDLYIGVFGWKGSTTANNASGNRTTVSKNRWAIGAKYEHEGWSARAEYVHHTGHKISDYKTTDALGNAVTPYWTGNARADGWYATVGVPCTKWLKMYARYDAYRETAHNGSLRSIYSLCPNFRLHKNLMFQVQYNYVCDKTAADRHYHELWGQTYFRF